MADRHAASGLSRKIRTPGNARTHGTRRPHSKEGESALNSSRQKIIPRSRVPALIRSLKRAGKKIVFTNGTFDILHRGHIEYLERAKRLGDILFVGVNSDRSVKSYKNPKRPLNPLADRMRILAALSCTDYTASFDEPTPVKLIQTVRPDVLVKGSDWKKKEIAGAREVELWGGCVRRIGLVPGRSTTRLLKLLNFIDEGDSSGRG